MPKDKKSKEKKEGSSSGKEVEIVKRKNSIVDSSGGSSSSSSSSSSSDASGNSSDHSASGDSDGFLGVFDNEKGTMTGEAGSSSSGDGPHCTVDIRDRTEEMRRAMQQNAEKKPVRLVDEHNEVPISEDTHLVPIDKRNGNDEEPCTSSAVCGGKKQTNGQQPTGKQSIKVKEHKKPKQAKQLTKKQKKELEKKTAGEVVQFPGQKERKPPLEHIVRRDHGLHVHHFNEWTGDDVKDGEMIVRGTNAAAQTILGSDTISIPFLRKEEELGPAIQFTDMHKNSQIRYLRHINTLGTYTGIPASLKPLHRMGYGIAASGMPDPEPLTLTVGGAKPFMKYQYSEYIMSGSKLTNWRSEFTSTVDMDRKQQEPDYIDQMYQLNRAIEGLINKAPGHFERATMGEMRVSNLRQLLLRFGEMERNLMRGEQGWRNMGMGVGSAQSRPRFDEMSRPARISFVVDHVLHWFTLNFIEQFDDKQRENRACTALMYLACTMPGEKPCYEEKHRKCSLLHFLLATTEFKRTYLTAKYNGGNNILHYAAMTGYPCQIDVLLRNGAPLNDMNEEYKTALGLSLRRFSTLVGRQLLWHGADLGGALSMMHIHPRTPRQTTNKEMSEYTDTVARTVSYKAREFMVQRMRAMNNSFTSWVEAMLIDADPRLALGVHSVKSSLHQIRIGQDILDREIYVRGRGYIRKTFQMAIERTEFDREPVVLFMIPCQFTRFDTTMPGNFPHLVRVPMITDALATATRIAEMEKVRVANGEPRREYKDELRHLRPVKLLGQPITISFGDGLVDRIDTLESFFSIEHNGIVYGYNLPTSITRSSCKYTRITVTMHIPEAESKRFANSFFMAQAIQVVTRGPADFVSNTFEVSIPIVEKHQHKDPRADSIMEQVAQRKAERLREMRLQEDRVREMVGDVESGVARKKKLKAEAEAAAAAANNLNHGASTSGPFILIDETAPPPPMARKLPKTKTE